MRTRLADERATMTICDMTGLDPFAVVGRLHAVWCWAGEHTSHGDVRGVTLKTIDRIAAHDGFASAMLAAEWLEELPEGGIRFPRWKRHNSKSAKQRALAAERQARKRAKKSRSKSDDERDNSVTNHAPRVEQSRVEQSREDAANATAQCIDRGVQGGKIVARPDRKFRADPTPPEFEPTLTAILGILGPVDGDQIGFLAKLAYAHAIGFEFPVPVWDYVGRAKGKGNFAGYLTEAIRGDLGDDWQRFQTEVPSPAHCQWILAQAGREAVDA